MRWTTAVLAVSCLPTTVFSSQQPMIEKDGLLDVIKESPFLSLHKAICEIDSTTHYEYNVAQYLIKFLEAHDFSVITQKMPSESASMSKPRLNIYAVPDPSKYGTHRDRHDAGMSVTNKKKKKKKPATTAKPKVLLTSHIDTVPPFIPYSLSSPHSPSSPSFNRSLVKISGRGTVDAKACVAAQITIAMSLLIDAVSPIDPADLALLFVVDEENGGLGMRHFSESDLYAATNTNYKAVIFGEPTENKLVDGHKGIFLLQIKAEGKAAHSGYPWLGRSANSMILPALTVLDKLGNTPEKDGGLPGSDKFGNTTVNVGYMQGGVASNVIPEHAEASLAFRLGGGTLERNKELTRKAVEKVDPDGLLELNFGQGYGPVNLDADVEGFDIVTVNYGTDVPNLKVKDGVKRYLYGPGTIFVAHGKDEGLTVGDLEEGLKGFEKLVRHALEL